MSVDTADSRAAEALALRLLAAREHGTEELRRKLAARGFAPEPVATVLADLVSRGLLSDARFVMGYVHERIAKGFGPLRIRAELRERGIDDDLVEPNLALDEEEWRDVLAAVHRRKFGRGAPADRAELARRARFLEYRGFTPSQVSRFLDFDA